MSVELIFIKHNDLNKQYLEEIINLKSQNWRYSFESQKKWISTNLQPCDTHVLFKYNDNFIGYLSINDIFADIDGYIYHFCGLGNVCISKMFQGRGLGKEFITLINKYFQENNKIGILLCHKDLISFYERCSWKKIKYNKLIIGTKLYSDYLMMYNVKLDNISKIVLNRNF